MVIGFIQTPLTQATQTKSDALEVAGVLVGVAATILSALLVFYRIYSVSRNNVLSSSAGQYTRILYLLIESSGLYVAGVVLYAILIAIPITDANMVRLEGFSWYSDPIFSFSSVRAIAM